MRPARKGPENARGGAKLIRPTPNASMRPARKGPENVRNRNRLSRSGQGFNEAGPQGAGKHASIPVAVQPPAGFNEAGPQGAGKPADAACADAATARASMRPARKGPENIVPLSRHEVFERLLQ